MNEIIKLKSRGEKNYLKLLKKQDGSESKTYALKTESPILRVGNIDRDHKYIDPAGGPMIIEGELLLGEYTVKSIDFVDGYGYTITFV